jgi:hypothetical protein
MWSQFPPNPSCLRKNLPENNVKPVPPNFQNNLPENNVEPVPSKFELPPKQSVGK